MLDYIYYVICLHRKKHIVHNNFNYSSHLPSTQNHRVSHRVKPTHANYVISCAPLKAIALEKIQMETQFNSTLFQRVCDGTRNITNMTWRYNTLRRKYNISHIKDELIITSRGQIIVYRYSDKNMTTILFYNYLI